VNDNYLFELERNLELQASSFLMQKDGFSVQSQIRTEHFQQTLFDRLRTKVNSEITIEVKSRDNFTGILLEIASDHICLEIGEKELAIPNWSIQAIKDLGNKSIPPTILQSKWNFQSLLRSNQMEHNQIAVHLESKKIISGKILGVYLDHFDLSCNNSAISFFNQNIAYISKDRDIND
jgi:molybdopterin-binding protein